MKIKINITVTLCFLLAIILRVLYLLTPQLNSDHAVIGLAGRHILQGEFPLFFYGVAFEGIIEGYLAALLFFLFGATRLVLDCIPAFMSLILIYVIYRLAKIIYGDKTAKLTLLFSCLSPSYFLLMTTVPMECYIESTILGVISFIIAYKIIYTASLNKLYFLLGLVIGFSLYLQFHIVTFAIVIGIFLFLNDKKIFFKKTFLLLLLGFIIGNSPLLIYNIINEFKTFTYIGMGRENSTFLGTLKHLFLHGLYIIIGARDESWRRINYIPYVGQIIYFIYIASFVYLFIKRRKGSEFLFTFLIIFSIIYWLSGRGEVNTRRYLFPLYTVLPIALGYFFNALREKNKYLFYPLIILILGSNLYTNIISIPVFNKQSLQDYKALLTRDEELYNFLKSKNIKGAYAISWWISLLLNFDFKEDIIFNNIIDEPYPKYQRIVDSQFNPAFVTYFSEFAHTFNTIGGSYKIDHIPNLSAALPPYTISYNFTPTPQILEEIDSEDWSIDSSHNKENTLLACDRDFATRWDTGEPQKKDMYFTIDLGKTYSNVTRICFNPGPRTDWPRGYKLYASVNGKKWKYLSGNPAFITPIFWDGPHPFIRTINGLIEIDFPPQSARYLKLALIKDKEYYDWSIVDVFIYRQKSKTKINWDVTKLKNRIKEINPKKIYADPWVTSHLDNGFYKINQNDPIPKDYIYRYFVIKPPRLKDYAFIVLSENYSSFIKQLGGVPCNTEDFGPYKLITFDKNINNTIKYYWDGFHLLKCTL